MKMRSERSWTHEMKWNERNNDVFHKWVIFLIDLMLSCFFQWDQSPTFEPFHTFLYLYVWKYPNKSSFLTIIFLEMCDGVQIGNEKLKERERERKEGEEQVVQTNYHCNVNDAWWRRKWEWKEKSEQMNGNANEQFRSLSLFFSFLTLSLSLSCFPAAIVITRR